MCIRDSSKGAKNKLLGYSFPGNVRELKAVIDLSAVMAVDKIIEVEDIQFNSIRKEAGFLTQEMTMESYKHRIIHFYLDKYDKDVLLVAKKLDIGKSTIYRMLKEPETSFQSKRRKIQHSFCNNFIT